MYYKTICRRGLAAILSASMLISGMPVYATETKEKEAEITPVYSWNFESNDLNGATLEGKAAIENDGIKGNVLNLPGGSAGAGSMALPEDLFSKLGNDGFTISMWVKPDSTAASYSKYFDASNSPLGTSYSGSHWWSTPDFGLATGGDVYDMTLYVGEADQSTSTCSKLKYDEHLKKGAWQHVVVSISPKEYTVYFNGEKISYKDAQDNTKAINEVLPSLFEEGYLSSMKYAAIGKSQYTSDSDFAGKIDDVNFYDSALDDSQVTTLFKSYGDIVNKKEEVTMTVDMAEETGAVKHGATGFLYGIGDSNVPSTNLLTALKPEGCEQKPANGLQHPSGDFLEIADTFLESGGEFIQIACPDIYANWPYEFESIPEYLEKLKVMVKQVKDAGYSKHAVYVPFNEADGNWYTEIWSGDSKAFLQAWKQAYDAIKSVDPDALIAGSNMCCFHSDHMKEFVQFCADNDCIPDQITWHVLNDSLYAAFPNNVKEFRGYEKEYWLDTGKTTEKKEIVINEYANFTELGVPGELASWLGLFEDEKVTACLAYWHISNNLSDLAADTNEPNGAWWLYKWYAEMSGNTLKLQTSGAAKSEFYGVASLDENKKSANVILGGKGDQVTLTLKNVNKTKCFGSKVKVKLESTSWTGINGAVDGTQLLKEEICNVDQDGNVILTIDQMDAASAYNITIAQADDDAKVGVITEGAWRQTYEGEDAVLSGSAVKAGKNGSYACSGSGQAQGLNAPGDSVTFKVDVPKDGYYKYEMVYGAATGNDTYDLSKNNPKNAVQTLYADSKKVTDMLLQNTLSWYMSGMHTEYVYLTAGAHELKVEATNSEGKATVDCMYLTYIGTEAQKEADQNEKTYEAEQSDFNVLGSQTTTTVTTSRSISGFSDAGYVTGLDTSVEQGGGIRFTAYAKENGLYDLTVRYAADQKAELNFYLGNTAKTLSNKISTKTVKATDGAWNTVTATVFLEKGINIVDLDATVNSLAVDKLTVKKAADQSKTITIQAEDCKTVGDVTTGTNTYASNQTYVKQMLGDANAANALILSYTAEEKGQYAITVYQSNKELFGSHAYNAQMVDRYITVSVNGGEPFNIFFRNTYSDESFKSQVIKVALQKGENTIKIYNDNSRVLKNGVGGVNTCANYTPNLDKFEITPAVVEKPAVETPVLKDADFTVLNTMLNEISALKESDYTKESWNSLNQLVIRARKLKQEVISEKGQPQIDQMVKDLVKAVANLEKVKAPVQVKKASLTKLQAAIKKANTVKRKNYTKASLNTMDLAKKVAEELVKAAPESNLQKVVDAATASLNNAISSLQKNPTVKKVKVGEKVTKGSFIYKVTKTTKGKETVTLLKPVKNTLKSAAIPDTIKVNGTTYKVTAIETKAFKNSTKLQKVVIGKNVTTIGKECFKNCKSLKSIQINTKGLKSVGKNAFSGIYKKAVIKVPKGKLTAYKKLLKNKGQKSTVKIK
ncbi:MAG: LamG-like jellyroll fold domain-containing protein [bacterium]|nr:LamG-like jellyroll fold domain-containing protein [bacterium]